MTFHSLQFLAFLASVVAVACVTPPRSRWIVLLLASLAFYAVLGFPHLVAVLLYAAAVSFLFGVRIHAVPEGAQRRRTFWIGVVALLLPLVLVKYVPFLANDASSAMQVVPVMATIGLSYFSLQAISYLADVYLEKQPPERHVGRLTLFLSFFPKLLQGPIERGHDLLPQLDQPRHVDYVAARSGLLLFAWGLFKKVVIAERLAGLVDPVYDNVGGYTGLAFLLATYAYAFQVFFDFSGYTDMALGAARLLGIDLTPNFRNPLAASSIADFWRRWHISFSRWLQDYIFKPLQMSWRQRGIVGTSLALLVTFLVSGIWHGANWTFLVWGLLHGVYLAGGYLYDATTRRARSRLLTTARPRWLKIVVTFQLVSLAWVFFRARSISDAWSILRSLAMDAHDFTGIAKYAHSLSLATVTVVVVASTFVLWVERDGGPGSLEALVVQRPAAVRWAAYYGFVLAILTAGVFGSSQFVYFQF
jgi:alginate O-acetyltransferase complex protein AlgI